MCDQRISRISRGVVQDAFGEQETGGQLEVMAGRPHGDGDGFVSDRVEADFERLFDGQ